MAEEWETPIGLTKECAISIDDSSDDDEVGKRCVDGADNVANTKGSEELQYYESMKGVSAASSSSYFNSSKPTTSTSKADNKHRIDSCTMSSKTSNNESTDTTTTITDDTQDVSIKSNNDSNADDNMVADNTKQPSSQDERKVDNTTKNDNPFASFAFTSGEASVPSSSVTWQSKKKLSSHTNSKSSSHNNKQQHTKRKNDNNGISSSVVTKKAKQLPPHSFFNKSTGSSEDIIRCKDKKYERQELISKWHKFADPNTPIEQQRFQVLVAARLHARCQEPVVLKAMDKLRKYFIEKDEARADNNEVQATSQSSAVISTKADATTASRSQQTSGQGLTVHSLANADPETEIAPLLKSVLFGNVKSKHIVQASKDVLQKFGGRVPESIVGLKSIMGIGPELAGVLNIVNKVDTYTQKYGR